MVEPVLNILGRQNFCNFVRQDTAKVSSLSLLKITAKPTHSLPCKEEDTNTMDRTSNK